jgi:hypothetical protein
MGLPGSKINWLILFHLEVKNKLIIFHLEVKINWLILFHLEEKNKLVNIISPRSKNKLVVCLEKPKILEKKFFKDKEKRIGYLFSRKVDIFWMRSPTVYTLTP